jgi:GTP1/Obg family GTP-binding protein
MEQKSKELLAFKDITKIRDFQEMLKLFSLTDKQREVLLKVWRGRPFIKIAKEQEISKVAVYNVYERAFDKFLKELRKSIADTIELPYLEMELKEVTRENNILKMQLEAILKTNKLINKQKVNFLFGPIKNLDLDTRTYNALRKGRINSVIDLIRKQEKELLGFQNLGQGSLQRLNARIKKYNLHLDMDIPAELV